MEAKDIYKPFVIMTDEEMEALNFFKNLSEKNQKVVMALLQQQKGNAVLEAK